MSNESLLSESAAKWLTEQLPEAKRDLVALANQNSGSSHLAGLLAMADQIEAWFDLKEGGDQPVSATRTSLPDRQIVSNEGDVSRLATGPVLRWDLRPELPRRVLLVIHYDTVFGPDHEFQSCQMLDDDRMGGPGVADAKGGIVVIRNAVRALEQFHLADQIGLTVVLNPDEEVGSLSSAGYLQEIASDFDFGLLFEPALPTGELVAKRKGSGNFEIVVHGRAAHAGRHFEDGRNAVALLSRMFVALDDLNQEIDRCTINVGECHGGVAVNVVPPVAVGRFNIRVEDDDAAKRVMERVESIVGGANDADGFQVQLFGGMTSPPKVLTPAMEALMQAVETVTSAVQGGPVQWRSTGGVCDGNKLAAAGLPNIDTMGPVGDGLHSSGEWVQVSSLTQKAAVVVELLARYASGALPELSRQS
ncbi:MAG: hydrolase [Planctomycetota bacterium]